MNDTEARVKKVVSQVLGIPVDKIKNTDRFVQDFHAESIQSIELVAGFDAEFDIEMDEDAALAVKNIADAIAFVDKLLAK